jgi:hypothetical protein
LKKIAIVGNSNFEKDERVNIAIQTDKDYCIDLLSERRIPRVGDHIEMSLGPGQCLVFEY